MCAAEALRSLNPDGHARKESGMNNEIRVTLEHLHAQHSTLVERLTYRDHIAWRLTANGRHFLATANWEDQKIAA
jgi:hypothetical protein